MDLLSANRKFFYYFIYIDKHLIEGNMVVLHVKRNETTNNHSSIIDKNV
jgi:hypothetical protein